MKRLRTKNNDNETLCWKCDNCTDGSKCEWALGRPVKGWEATPTAYPGWDCWGDEAPEN